MKKLLLLIIALAFLSGCVHVHGSNYTPTEEQCIVYDTPDYDGDDYEDAGGGE